MRRKAIWDKIYVPIYWFRPKEPVWCEDSELVSKIKNSKWENGFYGRFLFFFPDFFLVAWPFFTNLHEILASGPKLIFQTTLFYKKKLILTNRSRINDPPILTHMATCLIIMTQMWHILTFPGPSCQPSRILMVQNCWYRCPAYSYTCFMFVF